MHLNSLHYNVDSICPYIQVVMAQATHMYFDHPQEPDPEERGLYWAPRFTDTRKTFSFVPSDLYANADVARSGASLTTEDVCGKDGKSCVMLKKPENIIGKILHALRFKSCNTPWHGCLQETNKLLLWKALKII